MNLIMNIKKKMATRFIKKTKLFSSDQIQESNFNIDVKKITENPYLPNQ